MKLEVILQDVGSITIEDEVARSVKVVRKLAVDMLEELRKPAPNGAKRMGFGSIGTDRLEVADE